MKTVKEMKRYQKKSQRQCTTEKRIKPNKPKTSEPIIKVAPTVAHQRKKKGFAPVVATPATKEP